VEATAIKIYKTKEAVSCSSTLCVVLILELVLSRANQTEQKTENNKKNVANKKTKQERKKQEETRKKKENGIQTIIIISNRSKFIVKARKTLGFFSGEGNGNFGESAAKTRKEKVRSNSKSAPRENLKTIIYNRFNLN
jgi:mannitol-specific phosphotransferase system IIBC component